MDKFIFLVDFIVLDMDHDLEVPLILGRPFLVTTRALIDVGSEMLVIWVENVEASFKISKISKQPIEHDDAFFFFGLLA